MERYSALREIKIIKNGFGIMEKRKIKLMINKSGGSSTGENYRVRIPTPWVKKIFDDNNELEMLLDSDNERIIIQKVKEEQE